MPNKFINFRKIDEEKLFNRSVNGQINTTYNMIYLSADQFNAQLFTQGLNKVYDELLNYYMNSGEHQHAPQNAITTAKHVFSQFCQNLVYYIAHNSKNIDVRNTALNIVLDQELLIYKDEQGNITLYSDPKEEDTMLTVVCRIDFLEGFNKICNRLDKTLKISNKSDNQKLCAFLSHANKSHYTALNAAAYSGNELIVRRLVLLAAVSFIFLGGNDINSFQNFITHADNINRSPLNIASEEGKVKVVAELLSATNSFYKGNNNPDGFLNILTDELRYSALSSACWRGQVEVLRVLLDTAKANNCLRMFLMREGTSTTALNVACAGGHSGSHVEVARELLLAAQSAFGGNENPGFRAFLAKADANKSSPLNAACAQGCVACVRLLLQTAYLAFGSKNKDAVGYANFLMHADCMQTSSLNTACTLGYGEVVRDLLIAAKFAFGGYATDGFHKFLMQANVAQFSPLNNASKKGYTEIVQQLIDAAQEAFGGKDTPGFKAFLEQKNREGDTPLNAACKATKSETAKLLMKYGANAELRNEISGKTPRDNAPCYWEFIHARANSRVGQTPNTASGFFTTPPDPKRRKVENDLFCASSSATTRGNRK